MIERLAALLASQMEVENIIGNDKKEYYEYVLIIMLEKWITILSIIVISICLKNIFSTILFLFFFLTLRKRTGGFHMNTFLQCYLTSIAVYIVIIYLSTIMVNYMNVIYVLTGCAMVVIGSIGTVNHPNLALNSNELQEAKKSARYLAVFEGLIMMAGVLFNIAELYLCCMAIAIILCAILMIIAKILRQEVK